MAVQTTRVLFVISSLKKGGAEKVFFGVLNHFQTLLPGSVSLLTFFPPAEDHYLAPQLPRHVVYFPFPVLGFLLRLFHIRRTLKATSPTHIVSFMDKTNVLVLLASWKLPIRVIIADRCHPEQNTSGFVFSLLRDWLYPHASSLVVQTAEVGAYFKKRFPLLKTVVIPNSITASGEPGSYPKPTTSVGDQPFILAVGRLTFQKGFDLLLKAYSSLIQRLPNYTLVIAGEGELKSDLVKLAQSLNIEDRVTFLGHVDKLDGYYASCSLFVLSSRFEGLPNVLLEAMQHRSLVVAYDCPYGPREMIQNGQNGYLVPRNSPHQLSDFMSAALTASSQSQMREKARETAMLFLEKNILPQWQKEILSQ